MDTSVSLNKLSKHYLQSIDTNKLQIPHKFTTRAQINSYHEKVDHISQIFNEKLLNAKDKYMLETVSDQFCEFKNG